VIADTDLTVIQVWWEEKYGELDPWIAAQLERRSRRRYLLTLPDIPWEPDPMRESPHDRERLLVRYREILIGSGFPSSRDWRGARAAHRNIPQADRDDGVGRSDLQIAISIYQIAIWRSLPPSGDRSYRRASPASFASASVR
jgi:hypothetical protein